jgi:ABC-type sugar transport system ATPase subunit/ribose/xylose/arabinose/galactoside ABC-type transport system permease subunit
MTKSFPGVRALDAVDFDCMKGEVHALIGENGAGKSTLMKILGGIYHPDAGELIFKAQPVETFSPQHAQSLGIALIHQELSLLPYLTVAENIFLGREPQRTPGFVDSGNMERQATSLLNQLDGRIAPRTPVYRLSPAQRQLVEIAKAISHHPDVVIMDEPSSSLAEHELQRLFEIIQSLKAEGVTVVYISHRLEEILTLADRVTVLRDGKKIGTLPSQEIDRQRLIQMMVGRDIEVLAAPRQRPPGDVILEVKGLSRSDVFKDIHLQLRQGEVLGLAGLIGSGRSELARAIFGADPVDEGAVFLHGQPLNLSRPSETIGKGLALIPEDRKSEGLIISHSVRENVSLPSLKFLQKLGFINASAERKMVKQSVEQLDIHTAGLEQQVAYLSGGNQQKVVLAKWLNAGPAVLIFDEPTRGIDVGAKAEIHNLIRQLADSGKAILMISSELPEILNLSDRIVVMSGGRIAGELPAGQAKSRAERGADEEAILALAYKYVQNRREQTNGMPGAGGAAGSPGLLRSLYHRLASFDLGSSIVFIVLALLVIAGMLGPGNFLSLPNFANLLRQMVIPMLLGIGQTFVILSGGIDLSVSSIVTLANVFAAGMMVGMDERLLPVALFCLGVGLLIGLVNAFVIIKLRVVPIIATLGMMVIGQGIALSYTREPIGLIPRGLYTLSTGQVGPLPTSTIWLLLIIFLSMLLLYRTPFGRHLYAAGGDSEVARLSGIAVDRIRALTYLLSGLLAAATGLFLTSRMGSGDPKVGPGLELDSIAAVLLGGTILGGGRGGLVGTIAGVLVLVLVGNVFNQLGLRVWHQQVAKGLIIVLAVAIYRLRDR